MRIKILNINVKSGDRLNQLLMKLPDVVVSAMVTAYQILPNFVFVSSENSVRSSPKRQAYAAYIRRCNTADAELTNVVAEVAVQMRIKPPKVFVDNAKGVYFAASENMVFVSRGAIDYFAKNKTDISWKALIAHELAHIKHRDWLRYEALYFLGLKYNCKPFIDKKILKAVMRKSEMRADRDAVKITSGREFAKSFYGVTWHELGPSLERMRMEQDEHPSVASRIHAAMKLERPKLYKVGAMMRWMLS